MILEQILNSGVVPDQSRQWVKGVTEFAFGNIRWYSIFIILGFIVAIVGACMKMWKRYKISVEPFYWFILIGVPVSILGANFGSCVLGYPAGKDWSQFWTSFGTGLAVEWGVLFCFIAGCIYFPLILKLPRYRVRDEFGEKPEVKKVSMWLYMDAILPCVLIAQCIGRWGNYFNQEVFGSIIPETNTGLIDFLNKFFPYMYITDPLLSSKSCFHQWCQPLFLWEMLFNFAGFLLLYVAAEFIKVRKTGDMAASYFIWYGIIRLCLEPLRDSQYKSWATMIMSIIYVVAGVGFIVLNHAVIARYRNKKVFGFIVGEPVKAIQETYYPNKIKKLEKKLNKENLKNKEDVHFKLNETKNKWSAISAQYQSPNWKDKYNRTEQEMIFFGRW